MGKFKRNKKKRSHLKLNEIDHNILDYFESNDVMRVVASTKLTNIFRKTDMSIPYVISKTINFQSKDSFYNEWGSVSMSKYMYDCEKVNEWVRYHYVDRLRSDGFGNEYHQRDQYHQRELSKIKKFEYNDLIDIRNFSINFGSNNLGSLYKERLISKNPIKMMNHLYEKTKDKDLIKDTPIFSDFRIIDLQKFNFLDISDDENYITFVPMDNKNLTMWKLGDWDHFKDHKRVKVKIGRFIRQYCDFLKNNKYLDVSYMINPYEIEKVVNSYKFNFCLEYGMVKPEFKIYRGESIREAYKFENQIRRGTLNTSCMNGKVDFLDIYVKNSNVSLLVLEMYGKIFGRALLWELSNGKKMMDRIYYGRDQDIDYFNLWASENGYKSPLYLDNRDMVIKLKNKKHSSYPYLDSLRYFNRLDGTLQSKRPKIRWYNFYKKKKWVYLNSTNGGYEKKF